MSAVLLMPRALTGRLKKNRLMTSVSALASACRVPSSSVSWTVVCRGENAERQVFKHSAQGHGAEANQRQRSAKTRWKRMVRITAGTAAPAGRPSSASSSVSILEPAQHADKTGNVSSSASTAQARKSWAGGSRCASPMTSGAEHATRRGHRRVDRRAVCRRGCCNRR